MAGSSVKSIKLRIHSMQNTRQITKAMEMVAASKMNKAQEIALRTRPYYTTLHQTLSRIAAATRDFSSPYLQKREEKRICCIAIAGDRGLAGGYNSNALRLAASTLTGEENCVLPIGRKAGEYFRRLGTEILTEDWLTAEEISVGCCFTLARHLAGLYRNGRLDAIDLVFTRWNSILSQEPCVLRLLPLPKAEMPVAAEKRPTEILYEPDCSTVFNAIIPEYLGGVIYGALCESLASELSARRMAMDSATQNADEMIEKLNLQYNRARQGSITQELTEIVAGAEE